MSFLQDFGLWGGGWTGWIIPFLLVLTVVVFFHELGHFLIARWCGVRVMVFSVGFGPELLGFTDRRGTRWKMAAIPLGGYVKFFGDENAASVPDQAIVENMDAAERRVSFFHQRVASRAAIVAAGPIANFLLAIVIFAGIFMFYGKHTTAARIDTVLPGSAAASAGFQPGDTVVAIDGRRIQSFAGMQRIVSAKAGRTLEFRLERGGVPVTLFATPELKKGVDNFGNSYCHAMLGVSRAMTQGDVKAETVGPMEAVWLGIDKSWFIVARTFTYIGGVFSGTECADQVGGPIGIAEMSGQIASMGLVPILDFVAMLSVSIGLLNLFPVPLLDGGHLLFYAIEAVRGRPLSERAQELGFRVGLALVGMLMLFATYNDILNRVAPKLLKLLSM